MSPWLLPEPAALYSIVVVGNSVFVLEKLKSACLYSILAIESLWAVGCATTSTIETRKQERYGVYSELSPEHKAAVDAGQIKVGMTTDAVYIAWGKPSEILTGESSQGSSVTWLYHGTYFEEHRLWGYPYYGYYCFPRRYYYPGPYFAYDYYPRTYVRAEVRLVGGVVKEWRSLPPPR